MYVTGSAGCAWGGVSINAFDPEDRRQFDWYNTGWWELDSSGEAYSVGAHDGILDDKEIEDIKSIGITGAASLKAIEYLTALETLGISHYTSTEINIRGHTSLREIK